MSSIRFQSIVALCFVLIARGVSAEDAGAALKLQPDLTELSLEQLTQIQVPSVTGASKFEQKETDAPSSVSVITEGDIQKFGYRTLADALRSEAGFDVSYDRDYGYIGVRGFNRPGDYGGRVLILVDGEQLNEPIYDSAFNMTDFILDLDLIERIEIIRGPGSSIYGDNAFFAVINVVTKSGGDFKNGELAGSYGTYNTWQERLTFGHRFESGLDILFSGSLYDTDGARRLHYKEFDAVNHGVAQGLDGDRFHSFFGKVSYGDLTLEGAYVSRKKDVPTAPFGTAFNDPGYNTVDTRAFVNLKYEHQFDGFGLMARTYYDYYRFDGDYPFAMIGADQLTHIIINRDYVPAQWAGAELQLTKTLFDRNRVLLGAEYRDTFQALQQNYDVSPRTTYLDSNHPTQRCAFYLQDEWTLSDSLSLNVGARYDHFSTFGDTFNPRAALIYHPWKATTVKGIYGTAFRAPNTNESYYTSPTQGPNPSLQPEKIRTFELVGEQQLGKYFQASLAAYSNRISKLISEEDDNGLIVFQNRDNVSARGVEMTLESHAQNGLSGRFSYTLQETKDLATGLRLSNSPAQLFKLNLSVPFYSDKVFGDLELQASADRRTLLGKEAEGFYLVNFTLFTQRLLPNLELSASVYNLFNAHYGYPGAQEHLQDVITQDGRMFRLKATYSF